MKKLIAAILALALIGSSSGCAGTTPAVTETPTESSIALQATEIIEPAADSTETPTEAQPEIHKPTETPQSTEAPKTTEAPKPTEAPKTTEASKPTDAPKPAEASKPAEAPKPTAEPKPTEAPKPAHTHSYTSQVIAPTCTAQGYTEHTCSCGDSYNDSYTAALGHSYTDTVVEATTTSGGYTVHTCSRCGDSFTDSYIEQLWWDTEEAVAAICAEANAYAEAQGAIVDPEMAQSWAAPETTRWKGSSPEWLYNDCIGRIDLHLSLGWKYAYVTYEPDSEGGFWVYVMKG